MYPDFVVIVGNVSISNIELAIQPTWHKKSSGPKMLAQVQYELYK